MNDKITFDDSRIVNVEAPKGDEHGSALIRVDFTVNAGGIEEALKKLEGIKDTPVRITIEEVRE